MFDKINLLGDEIQKTNLEVVDTIKNIDISKIQRNEKNFYNITEEAVKELAESIKINGLLEPLIVYLDEEKFKLLSGHTRLNALELLNVVNIPCKIIKRPENGLEEEIIIMETNRQRTKNKEDLKKEIKYLKQNYDELKRTNAKYKNINIQKLIAEKLGISKSTVIRNLDVPNDKVKKEKKINTKETAIAKNIKNIEKLKDFDIEQESIDYIIMSLKEL